MSKSTCRRWHYRKHCYHGLFEATKYGTHHLEPLDRPLVGFGGSRVTHTNTIVWHVHMGKKEMKDPIRWDSLLLTLNSHIMSLWAFL